MDAGQLASLLTSYSIPASQIKRFKFTCQQHYRLTTGHGPVESSHEALKLQMLNPYIPRIYHIYQLNELGSCFSLVIAKYQRHWSLTGAIINPTKKSRKMFYVIGVRHQHWPLCCYPCLVFGTPKCNIPFPVNFIYFTIKNVESILFV